MARRPMHEIGRAAANSRMARAVQSLQAEPSGFEAEWIPAGKAVTIGGRKIKCGMLYVGGEFTKSAYLGASCPEDNLGFCSIDPGLKISKSGSEGSDRPPFEDRRAMHPGISAGASGFRDFSPMARGIYLDWLAGGADVAEARLEHLYLRLRAMEHRALMDESESADGDRAAVMEEMRSVCGDVSEIANCGGTEFIGVDEAKGLAKSLSVFQHYANLLECDFMERVEPPATAGARSMTMKTMIAMGRQMAETRLVDAHQALAAVMGRSDPPYALKHAPAEFGAVFLHEFERRNPDGFRIAEQFTRHSFLKVNPYRSLAGHFAWAPIGMESMSPFSAKGGWGAFVAGASVKKCVDGAVIDPWKFGSVMKEVTAVAGIAARKTEKYARHIKRKGNDPKSFAAMALLPAEIRPAALGDAGKWLEDAADGDLVSMADLAERVIGEVPAKLSAKQLRTMCESLEAMGFGLAPDPALGMWKLDIGGKAAIYRTRKTAVPDMQRIAALAAIAASLHVGSGGGKPSARCLDHALALTEDGEFSATIRWLADSPPKKSTFLRKLKDGEVRGVFLRCVFGAGGFRRILAEFALIDGQPDPARIAAAEEVHKALGLDDGLVYSDLHGGGAQAGGELDEGRIAAVRSDSEKASAILEDVFGDGGGDPLRDEMMADVARMAAEPGVEVAEVAIVETKGGRGLLERLGSAMEALRGLDPKHVPFALDVSKREHWTEKDLADLAEKHGLMLAGALETINEWAWDAVGDAMLDEHEGFSVTASAAEHFAKI